MCERHDSPPSRVLAYGDSQSDVPLFKRVSVSVAVHADSFVRSLATVHYTGDDLHVAADIELRAMRQSEG